MEQRGGAFPDVTLAVVAGGRGERLGGVAKGLLEVEGRTVLERLLGLQPALKLAEVLLVANVPEPYARFGLRTVADVVAGKGAPGGVHAALVGARTEWVLAVACDMPFVSPEAVRLLLEARSPETDALCFEVAGRPEPLLAVYRATLAGPWGELLKKENPSLRALLSRSRAKLLPEDTLRQVDAQARAVLSINTPDDLASHGAKLSKSPRPPGEGWGEGAEPPGSTPTAHCSNMSGLLRTQRAHPPRTEAPPEAPWSRQGPSAQAGAARRSRMGRMNQKVAVVTGAASGIGRATAELLLREGARVVLTDVDASGEAVARELREAGGETLFLTHDVADEPAWEAVMARTRETFGGLDVLVNNAGISASSPVTEQSLTEWRRVLAVNLDGVFLGTKHGVRAMRATGRGGAIINMASVAGLVGNPGTGAYAASKGGVRAFTKAVAVECAPEGIRVNAVFPSGVRTPIWEHSEWWPGFVAQMGGEAAAWKVLESAAPMGRMAEPGEIAEAVLYLASDAARFVTGAELVIDGGYTAR